MIQFAHKLRKSIGLPVLLVKFWIPDENGKFQLAAKRFVKFRQGELRLDKDHAYPLKMADWTEQQGNMQIMNRDYLNAYKVYSLWEVAAWRKPDTQYVTAREFAANKVADVAKAVTTGAQMNAGLIIIIAVLAAGIMGGALLGYFGLPALTGQKLIDAPKEVSKLVLMMLH